MLTTSFTVIDYSYNLAITHSPNNGSSLHE